MTPPATHAAVEAVWRIESAKIIAALARRTGDLALAEDLAQDALVAALERWPQSGVPDNPAAWLMAAARRRGVDVVRRRALHERREGEIASEMETWQARPDDAREDAIDDEIGDDRLRLLFMCCHPVLSLEARMALTLRLLGGLTTAEIARAFLSTEPTIAQRIVRAKRTLTAARVPFDVPRGPALDERLGDVMNVIYLVFNEGYSASSGDAWIRPTLCDEAMRLGRILAALAPDEPEVHGLVALMELQASRFRARVGADGEPVLLMDQDRAKWDFVLISHGLAALRRAESSGTALGPYALQASIAACHARAHRADETDWPRIAALYDALSAVSPSPVVELNRAVAVGMAFGPAAGLEIVDALTADPALARYHLLPAVRADLLAKLGRTDDARAELARAATLAGNPRERDLLLRRAAALTA